MNISLVASMSHATLDQPHSHAQKEEKEDKSVMRCPRITSHKIIEGTFLPKYPTMALFLKSVSPSFVRYERDIVCVEGIYTFDKLAALPYEKYLGIMLAEDARKLFNAVQATKNGELCPYGDNSGRMLPVGYTHTKEKLSHEWDWSEPEEHFDD